MQDRIPVNPGRVLITPENGSPAYYANMVRADNPTQEGTPLNKNSLLRDATAALFGLGVDAVPDDVLAFLGKYNRHWWRRVGAVAATYQLGYEKVNALVTTAGYVAHIYYSDNIVVADDGAISLSEPIRSFEVVGRDNNNTGVELKNLNEIKGKFFYKSGGLSSVDVPEKTILYRTNTTDAYFDDGCCVSVQPVYGIPATVDGEAVYIHSTDRNAYPDNGTVDSLTYEYLGVPFDNAVTAAKIATGSYMGTGTYNKTSPNSIILDSAPKMMFISTNDSNAGHILGFVGNGTNGVLICGPDNRNTKLVSYGKTISWYNTNSAPQQMNESGITYRYTAIV